MQHRRDTMQRSEGRQPEITPEEGWRTIHATLAQAQSSLYMIGSGKNLLLWGTLTSVGFFALFAAGQLAPGFEENYPWYRGLLWGAIGIIGMIGSAMIGQREGARNADQATARSAGLKMFAYWFAVIAAAFLISAAAGLWSPEGSEKVPHVVIGVVALGYVLFGIMHIPALAFVGLGMAAAFYFPAYFLGDFAMLGTSAGWLAVTALGAVWVHRNKLS